MRPTPLVGIAVAALLLAGCVNQSPEPTGASTPTATASGAPSATPTPEQSAAPTPVDPAAYATQQEDLFGPGVDFDSVDGNIYCGIWEAYGTGAADAVTGRYAGCRPNELLVTYDTDPSTSADGNVGCNGGQLTAEGAPEPVCNNGQVFVGESPMNGPVGTLPVGSSISYAGFTCTSPDESTIECVRDSDGQGFTIGLDSYRYF